MSLQKLLPELKHWFDAYAQRYCHDDPSIQTSINLKVKHTYRVCAAARDIGASEHLSKEELCLVETAALLHDIGRFEQFRRYRTFLDQCSEDHAALGVKIIQAEGLLESLATSDIDLICRVVQYHNKAALPVTEDERFLFFLKLVRDADKVDIWYVVTQYYQNAGEKRNAVIELDLPDDETISDSACQSLMKGEIVKITDVRNLNDFKLLQIGWIYDLNFKRTFQIVSERNYLQKLHQALPQNSHRVDQIIHRAQAYLARNCSSG